MPGWGLAIGSDAATSQLKKVQALCQRQFTVIVQLKQKVTELERAKGTLAAESAFAQVCARARQGGALPYLTARSLLQAAVANASKASEEAPPSLKDLVKVSWQTKELRTAVKTLWKRLNPAGAWLERSFLEASGFPAATLDKVWHLLERHEPSGQIGMVHSTTRVRPPAGGSRAAPLAQVLSRLQISGTHPARPCTHRHRRHHAAAEFG